MKWDDSGTRKSEGNLAKRAAVDLRSGGANPSIAKIISRGPGMIFWVARGVFWSIRNPSLHFEKNSTGENFFICDTSLWLGSLRQSLYVFLITERRLVAVLSLYTRCPETLRGGAWGTRRPSVALREHSGWFDGDHWLDARHTTLCSTNQTF